MEVEGRAAYLTHDASGLVLGLAFEQVPGAAATALRALVGQRCPPMPAVLPPKARRRPEPEDAAEGATEPLGAPALPEPAPEERRQSPRLSLGAGFHARFMAGDDLVAQADLLDLSAGGCCLRLPLERCREILQGAELDEFHFLHPDLPRGVLRGRVKWVLGRGPGALEAGGAGRYCLVGVAFVEVPEALGKAIADYVARHVPGKG